MIVSLIKNIENIDRKQIFHRNLAKLVLLSFVLPLHHTLQIIRFTPPPPQHCQFSIFQPFRNIIIDCGRTIVIANRIKPI